MRSTEPNWAMSMVHVILRPNTAVAVPSIGLLAPQSFVFQAAFAWLPVTNTSEQYGRADAQIPSAWTHRVQMYAPMVRNPHATTSYESHC